MSTMPTSSTTIIALTLFFIILVSPLTAFVEGESAADEYPAPPRFCTDALFAALAERRNSVTIPMNDSLRDALKEADRALASMPTARLVITALRTPDEQPNIDRQRAEYIRSAVISGRAGITIDPDRVVINLAGVLPANSRKNKLYLAICFAEKYVVTPKIADFTDASLTFSIRGSQMKIKAALLEFFNVRQLFTRLETTDDGVSIITAYDYAEPRVGRRDRRAAYLVQIAPTNKDGYCPVRLKYLVESKGDRERTWSVTEEDTKSKPQQLNVIADQINLLANRSGSK